MFKKSPIFALLLMSATAFASGVKQASSRPRVSSVERMTRARLKAAHESAEEIRRSRRAIRPDPKLFDFRAILHAHAEDSAHTAGTRPEMLAEAKLAGVHAILLTDHYRPPRDFIADSWRGLREGILFLPGSEARGFLLYPSRTIIDQMGELTPKFVTTVTADGGLIFLSHIEERRDHPMDGLTGMEIYNRHYDAKQDRSGLLSLIFKLTSPSSLRDLEDLLRLYPDELFAFDVEYPVEYLRKWDAETRSRRLTGVAANDCHHNQVLVVKMVDEQKVRVGTVVDGDEDMQILSALLRPGIREMTRGHKAGDILARIDLDPYHRSFRNVSTHVLATELSENAIRTALREGRAYVSHDWICNPTGFRFELRPGLIPRSGTHEELTTRSYPMGSEVKFTSGLQLVAEAPATCTFRLMKDGECIEEKVAHEFDRKITEKGVYRVECWLTLGGEDRVWILSNPIYVR